jgi:hypothetical protein
MAFPRIGGAGIPLNLGAAVTNAITLQAGQLYIIPAGTYFAAPGPYTCIQWLDAVSGLWRDINADIGTCPGIIDSDGANFRLANLTGCPVAALITNSGSGLTNGIGTVNVVPSSGASVWQTVVGGAINATVAITAAGNSYTYPPTLLISAPKVVGGIQATATCTVTAGAITGVSVTNQGAGYLFAPTITVINDQRDTTGNGAILTVNPTLAASGQLTALYPTNPGISLSAPPTFTFSPASSIAATPIMDFVVLGFTVSQAGAGGGATQPFLIIFAPKLVAGTRALNTAGPIADTGIDIPRAAWVQGTTTAGGAVQISGSVIVDAGYAFQAVPDGYALTGQGIWTTAPWVVAQVGGITDTSFLHPV